MNSVGIAFTAMASALLLALPRRFAALPLLLAAVCMTRGQILEIGPAHFTVIRILVAVGILRVLLRGERLAHGVHKLDVVMLLWATLLIATSAFHTTDAWIYRAGIVWTELGCYILLRVFLRDWQDIRRTVRFLCVALVPIAIAMIVERLSGVNQFAFLGGVNEIASVREGKIRASGPFVHPILAGTVGATCFAMAFLLWRREQRYALTGLLASGGIVLASNSSGPVMMLFFILVALSLWNVRSALRAIRWGAVAAAVVLDIIMKDPVYFLMARIDITGGSKGWHRARLIQSSLEHLDEWWLVGTDYTRHWMATGITANDRHTDITNHFLAMGVMGGIPLMMLFILLLVVAFRAVGHALRRHSAVAADEHVMAWTLGAMLFGYVINAFSISLFDQAVVFFYLVLAAIVAVDRRRGVLGVNRVRVDGEWSAGGGVTGPLPKNRHPRGACRGLAGRTMHEDEVNAKTGSQ